VKINGARATAPAVSRRFITAEVQIKSQHNPCGICGGQSGTETVFYPGLLLPIYIPQILYLPSTLHSIDTDSIPK
jgi:hypothetical protein